MKTNGQRMMSAAVLGGLLAWVGAQVLLVADTHPDFSGTWIVESVSTTGGDRSGDGGFRRGGGGGGGFGGGFGRRGGFGGGRRGSGGNGGASGTGDRGDARGRGNGEAVPRFVRGQHVEFTQTETELTEIVAPDAGGKVVHYPLDGSDGFTSGPNGNALKTKTSWDGVALVTETKATAGGKFHAREVRTLGADGRATIQTTIDGPFGKRTVTATLTKQEG